MRKTKIVCTLGPANRDPKVLEAMLRAGMNVARLNFSHGDHEEQENALKLFREVRDRLGMPAAVLLDTKGPEIRTKDFKGGKVTLNDGDEFTLTTRELDGDASIVSITYKNLPKEVKTGDRILIDDGKLQLSVKSTSDTDIVCEVVHGGEVGNHKGINVPGVHLTMPYLSENDKADLLFGVEHHVDYVAASFIRNKEDVIAVRKFLDYHGGYEIKIISKIENGEGIDNFEEILAHSDGIMVARGDMGVEVEYERLPGIQKRFISECYKAGKVVITATQMLESMIKNPSPTRAEITDVANAVFDGTSAVMLSGETANGKYPVKAIEAMAKIAEQAEQDAFEMDVYSKKKHNMDDRDTTNAICDASCTTARDIKANAIIAVTKAGGTARLMSKFRPEMPIVAATPSKSTFHQLSLCWGVFPVLSRTQENSDLLIVHAIDCAKQIDIVKNGDKVVITAGVPLDIPGNTNLIRVQVVGDPTEALIRMHEQ